MFKCFYSIGQISNYIYFRQILIVMSRNAYMKSFKAKSHLYVFLSTAVLAYTVCI